MWLLSTLFTWDLVAGVARQQCSHNIQCFSQEIWTFNTFHMRFGCRCCETTSRGSRSLQYGDLPGEEESKGYLGSSTRRWHFENELIFKKYFLSFFSSPRNFSVNVFMTLLPRWELCSVSSWRMWCETQWRTRSTPSARPSSPPTLCMLSNGKDVLSMALATELAHADANLLVSCMESKHSLTILQISVECPETACEYLRVL